MSNVPEICRILDSWASLKGDQVPAHVIRGNTIRAKTLSYAFNNSDEVKGAWKIVKLLADASKDIEKQFYPQKFIEE